jgi:hypothetical protein
LIDCTTGTQAPELKLIKYFRCSTQILLDKQVRVSDVAKMVNALQVSILDEM